MSSPFFALKSSQWAAALGLLPLPLESEFVLIDLAHLENEGRRGRPFPSMAALRKRWGLSRRQVDRALAGELGDWHDESHPLSLAELRQVGRSNSSRFGSEQTTELSTEAGTETGTELSTDENTNTPLSDESGHGAEHGSGHGDGHGADRETAEKQPPRSPTDAEESAALARVHAHLDQQDQQDQQTVDLMSGKQPDLVVLEDKRSADRKRISNAVQAIHKHWHARHSKAPDVPTDDNEKKIRDRLKSTLTQLKKSSTPPPHPLASATRDCCLVVDWAHTAPDAAHWQGFNKNGPNGTGKAYLGISALFKKDKWGDRLQSARDWRDAGREENQALGVQQFVGEVEPAWGYLLGLLRDHDLPAQLHPHPDKDQAFRAAIDAVGIDGLRRSTDFERRAMRKTFETAYLAARAAGGTIRNTTNERKKA